VRIRVATAPADWRAIRSLCCRTGNAGAPIDPGRWPLFAELWIGPYQRLVPAWTYVADADGAVVGYLTGCPDTPAFRRGRRLRVTLPIVLGILGGRYAWTVDARRTLELALGWRRGVEARLTHGLTPDPMAAYPAHLHMNVEAASRSQGIGAALIARFARDLEAAGSEGIHLFCGPGPRPFYARQGFADLAALEVAPGRWVYMLGRRLGGAGPARPAG
jgi:GNAT superfamily N-acetyltransferase